MESANNIQYIRIIACYYFTSPFLIVLSFLSLTHAVLHMHFWGLLEVLISYKAFFPTLLITLLYVGMWGSLKLQYNRRIPS